MRKTVEDLLLAQSVAASYFSEPHKDILEAFTLQVSAYRDAHGFPIDPSQISAEREYAFGELPIEAREIVTKWMTLSEQIFTAGGDGPSTPFSGF